MAKTVFAEAGANASLDDIARRAGVGPGTLYRHFPSRTDLLKAVYQDAAQKLVVAAAEFTGTLSPVEALRAWLLLFVDYLADKQIIAPALAALVDDPHQVFAASYGQNLEAIGGLLKRAVQSGDLRGDINAIDLMRALVGISSFGAGPDWQQSARKMVDVLVLGSRPGAQAAAAVNDVPASETVVR